MTAPMVRDGALYGGAFLANVDQILAPTLEPGGIVIMDNPPAHKPTAARAAIETAGARTVDDHSDAIAQGIETFTEDQCQNYFPTAGYGRE